MFNIEECILTETILSASEARAYMYEALIKVKEGRLNEVDYLIEMAEEAIGKACNLQDYLSTEELKGEKIKNPPLFVHSKNHILDCMVEKDQIKGIINMTRERRVSYG